MLAKDGRGLFPQPGEFDRYHDILWFQYHASIIIRDSRIANEIKSRPPEATAEYFRDEERQDVLPVRGQHLPVHPGGLAEELSIRNPAIEISDFR